MAIRVGAALQQAHGHVQCVRRAQNGAQIAGVLDTVQQEHTGSGRKVRLPGQAAQEHRPLGGRHGGYGGHHVLRHPDQAHPLRHFRAHTIGQDHRVQPGAVAHGLGQQLGAVCGKQAGTLPLPFGIKQPPNLLKQGIFPGGDPFFSHSFCIASSAAVSPSTASTSSPWIR